MIWNSQVISQIQSSKNYSSWNSIQLLLTLLIQLFCFRSLKSLCEFPWRTSFLQANIGFFSWIVLPVASTICCVLLSPYPSLLYRDSRSKKILVRISFIFSTLLLWSTYGSTIPLAVSRSMKICLTWWKLVSVLLLIILTSFSDFLPQSSFFRYIYICMLER